MDPNNNNNTSFHDHSKHAIEDFANRWWIWEILASVVSIVLLASIFVILIKYDNKSLDAWPVTWKINSVVSFITNIPQIGMMVPVAAGISQLKWLWYKKNHSLADIDKFDQAGRGPFGAVFLLFSCPFK
jgi:hypothetical protein